MRLIVLSLCLSALAFAQTKSVTAFTKGMKKIDGFITLYIDSKTDKVYGEVPYFDRDILYYVSLPAGIGSNDIGLDRGQLGDRKVVRFKRIGKKILLIEQNLRYQARSENAMERRAVEEAFAKSVIWGFKTEAQSKSAYLIDLTDFINRDAHGVAQSLSQQNQGNLRFAKDRSAILFDDLKSFPKNTELKAMVTLTGDIKGVYLRSVTPDRNAVTVQIQQSFVELPEIPYKTRKHDPRAPYFGPSYFDYATPIHEPLVKRIINRHRLEKINPGPSPSKVKQPIVYWVDNGAPEPIRSALVDGAKWWAEAFEKAGFIDAYQVKILPDDADPSDIRYHTIQWVHRSTRGWSYGGSITDPRSGEILKGDVTLGSLRIRQDFMIAEGLLSPYADGTTVPKEMQEMALARLRQLSAHEVGHTLGIAHNFFASVNDRASVMDYPHPLVKLKDGKIDLSDAYDVGIGQWDIISIQYGYSEFAANANEDTELNKILTRYRENGYEFISDADARGGDALHPYAHLWDNGKNAIDELNRVMEVRKVALDQFSEKVIRNGQPMGDLESKLVPIYFFHRYQLEAAARSIGGMNYRYGVRGDAMPNQIVDPMEQRRAIKAMLNALDVGHLKLPQRVLNTIPPKPYGYSRDREQFKIRTRFNLDPIAIAESAANETFSLMLHPRRLNRMVDFASRANTPTVTEMLRKIVDFTFKVDVNTKYDKQILMAISYAAFYQWSQSLRDARLSTNARVELHAEMNMLLKWLTRRVEDHDDDDDDGMLPFRQYILAKGKQLLAKPDMLKLPAPQNLPPGSPIGHMCGGLHE